MIEELRKNLKEKRKQTQARFNSARENFEKREKKVKTDLYEASKTRAELSKKFKWWSALGGLP